MTTLIGNIGPLSPVAKSEQETACKESEAKALFHFLLFSVQLVSISSQAHSKPIINCNQDN